MARSAGAQTMLSVCRFCLCQEEDSLVPMDEVLACLLTLEDVVRFTGIQVSDAYCANPFAEVRQTLKPFWLVL